MHNPADDDPNATPDDITLCDDCGMYVDTDSNALNHADDCPQRNP